MSAEKREYQPLPDCENQDPLQTIGKALANILPNACLFKGLYLGLTNMELVVSN